MPQAVGSLQKPWVVRAWAEANPGEGEPPQAVCRAGSRCWRASGHGTIGLVRAVASSCNEYFLSLARNVPEESLRRSLADAGFVLSGAVGPEAAIGLADAEGSVAISPASLLAAYRQLLTRSWPVRDDLRLAVLDGMREAAHGGTGSGLGLGGLLVKTGTVRARAAGPQATTGWALAADADGARLWLARLDPGSGAGAAARLGALLAADGAATARPRGQEKDSTRGPAAPGSRGPSPREGAAPGADRSVRVRLFQALRPERILAKNVGTAPAPCRGCGGPAAAGEGATVEVRTGTRLGSSTWELSLSPYGLVRRVRGTLEADGTPPRLFLETTLRDWVDGVLLGELGDAAPSRSGELAAAAMRFLARGRRHGDADVCDLTHCARFAGFGPDVEWTTPLSARKRPGVVRPPLDDETWWRAVEGSREAGPAFWTLHCGGAPLSEHAVWGTGSEETTPCPRHGAPSSASAQWRRKLSASLLRRAFGEEVVSLSAVDREGVRLVRVVLPSGPVELSYDDVHARLARVGTWDLLPSPPDRFEKSPDGFEALGRGHGHRVGLCLSD